MNNFQGYIHHVHYTAAGAESQAIKFDLSSCRQKRQKSGTSFSKQANMLSCITTQDIYLSQVLFNLYHKNHKVEKVILKKCRIYCADEIQEARKMLGYCTTLVSKVFGLLPAKICQPNLLYIKDFLWCILSNVKHVVKYFSIFNNYFNAEATGHR